MHTLFLRPLFSYLSILKVYVFFLEMPLPESVQMLNGHGESRMNTDPGSRCETLQSDTIATNMANQHPGNQEDKAKTGESFFLWFYMSSDFPQRNPLLLRTR